MSMFPTDNEIHKATRDALTRCEQQRERLESQLRAILPSPATVGDTLTLAQIKEARVTVPKGNWRYVAADNLVELFRGGRLIDFATPRSLCVSEEERNAMGSGHEPPSR